ALDGAAFKDGRLRAWSAAPAGGGDDPFRRLARLLELEAEAEARQALERVKRLPPAEAERTGDCLIDLVITDEYSSLGGRSILTLANRNRTLPLPWNRLGVGTPLLLSAAGAGPDGGLRGVVCERGDNFLRVAVNDPPDGEDGVTWRVDVSSDETARQRQR